MKTTKPAPGTMSDIVEIRLSPEQALAFRDVLDSRDGHLFAFVSRSYEPSEGRSVVRFQARRVSRQCALKIARLIREDKTYAKEQTE
jgi:hypothetical protein